VLFIEYYLLRFHKPSRYTDVNAVYLMIWEMLFIHLLSKVLDSFKSTIINKISGLIFTKLRMRKHKHRVFVCMKIDKATLKQCAQLDITSKIKIIYDVFALLVSTTPGKCRQCLDYRLLPCLQN
jgi:hypothetical protein